MVVVINIISECLSTFKTMATVRGQLVESVIYKVLGAATSVLITALTLEATMDLAFFMRVFYIVIGTSIGSIVSHKIVNRKKREALYKYIVKFDSKESAKEAIKTCEEADITARALGERTLVIYSEDKQKSEFVSSLKNITYYEATVVVDFNVNRVSLP